MHIPFFTAINEQQRRMVMATIAGLLISVLGAALLVYTYFWVPFVLMIVMVVAYYALGSNRVMLGTIVLLFTILPFGTLPFRAIITPSLLSLAILALLVMRVLNMLTTPDYRLNLTGFAPAVLGFLGFTLFALFLGARGVPDATTMHNYAKFVLGILLMFGVLDIIKDDIDLQWALRLLLIGGSISAGIGLILYIIPDALAERFLVLFGRIGYPTSGRVLRYVEDDPDGLMRAIGLAVDPNSYGGMLALIGAIAATQTIVAHPIFSRRIVIFMTGLLGTVLFLTFSRAALGGLIIAAIYVATIRYRRLWWLIIGGGLIATLLLVFLGVGEQFVNRIVQGVQFQDQANQMRLDEFNNAFAVIQAYPFFGIGFGRAPDIDLVAGVSSIYLAIAQRIGLIGLAFFLALMVGLFLRSWSSLNRAIQLNNEKYASWLVGLQAGLVAALAVGVLDHYFFNIEFSHMTALLWCTIGLKLAIARSIDQAQDEFTQ